MNYGAKVPGLPDLTANLLRDGSCLIDIRVVDNGGEGTSRNGPLWKDISGLVDQMPRLEIRAPANLTDGDSTEFVVDVPSDGYLNIVMIGPKDNGTVLFPNSSHTDNQVSAGRMKFPTAQMHFKIKAQPPYGKTLVAAFVTKERVNLMEEGFGNRDSSGKSVKPFAHVTRGGLKALKKGMARKNRSFQDRVRRHGRKIAGWKLSCIRGEFKCDLAQLYVRSNLLEYHNGKC